jgi:hypothetical protein
MALTAGSQLPAAFDAARLHATAASLARKRARATARAWPGLTRALGRRFGRLFAAYARTTLLPRSGGPLADGRAFALWLADREELPEAGRLQALDVDLRFVATPDGLVSRRWPTCQAAWLRQSGRLAVALWLPLLGGFRGSIPLWKRGR